MSDIDFSGRVAIVTGAGNGLGKEYALSLAARGAAVMVNDLWGEPDANGKEIKAADLVAQQIRDAGGKAIANYDSVATRSGGNAMVEAAMDHFGRVDIVINNAGNQRNGRFEDMSDDDFEAVLAVHLKGAFYVSQSAYKRMIQQRYGRFLFTSSSSGLLGHFIRTNYASAKAGLIGLMHSVSLEGERYGILANALLPIAAVKSSRLGKVPAGTLWPDWEARMPEKAPDMAAVGPSMTPKNVAALVVFLVSERCSSTHAMYSSVGGRFARVFIGVTQGWLAEPGRNTTPEEIDAHFAAIRDRSSFEEFGFITEEVISVARQIKARQK